MIKRDEKYIHPDILSNNDLNDDQKWKEEQKRRKKLRNEITHKLRFQILDRDNYTCFYCGRSRKTDPTIQLEIDHKIPLDNGGTNEWGANEYEGNLVTACYECNEGKKNLQIKDRMQNVEEKIYDFDFDKVIEVAESGDQEKFKNYLAHEDNYKAREYLYDLYTATGKIHCPKKCEDCVFSGTWYYHGCMQTLYRYVNKVRAASSVPLTKSVVPEKRQPKLQLNNTDLNNLQCDTCLIAMRCPFYKVGQSCAIDFSSGIINPDNPKDVLKEVVKLQQKRVVRGSLFETVDGGALDKNVSLEINILMRLIKELNDMSTPGAKFTFTGEAKGEGSGDVVGDMIMQILSGKNGNKIKNNSKNIEDAEVIENEEKEENKETDDKKTD